MKKILSFAFAFLLLFSFVFPSFAAETSSSVDYDHTSVETDLKTVYGDNLSLKFPKDTRKNEMSIITILEHGFTKDTGFYSDDYGLYIYMYNPSGIKVNGSILDIINMANGWDSEGNPTSFVNYYIKLFSSSDDNTLLKYKVFNKGTLAYVDGSGSRSYTVGSVDIYSGGANAESVNVAYTYKFSGYGEDLTCEKEQITVVNVEVHQTSYLTGNSDKGTNYSNQVNSVYFTIENDLMEKYGELYSVKYEYYKYRTSPIILVEYEDAFNKMYPNRGKIVNSTFDYNLNRFADGHFVVNNFLYGMDYIKFYSGIYLCEGKMTDYAYFIPSEVGVHDFYPNMLTTFFLVPGCTSADAGTVLVSSDEIQEYFLNYNASFVNGTVRDKYSADLFDLDYFSKDDIYHIETRTTEDTFDVTSYLEEYGWFNAFMKYGFGYEDLTGETIKDADCLKKLSLDDFKGATPLTMAKNLLVSVDDIDDISSLVTTSSTQNESVYLLRYAVTDDYYSMPLDYCQEGYITDEKFNDALYVEETVYLDFDIIQFSFKDELGKEVVISVTSSPSDGFTDIENVSPENKNNFNDFPNPFGGNGDGTQWWEYLIAAALGITAAFAIFKIVELCKVNKSSTVVFKLPTGNEDDKKE